MAKKMGWRQTGLWMVALLMFSFIASGCPKKMETAQQSVTPPEERVTPSPAVPPEEPSREQSPTVRESEINPPGTSQSGPGTLEMIHFDYDQASIRPDAKATLEKHAKYLQANPKVRIQIEGHCDERGTNEYNLALGERRAQATKRFLTALGIEARRLSTISYGEERPLCTDHEESCFTRNRRAQFAVEK